MPSLPVFLQAFKVHEFLSKNKRQQGGRYSSENMSALKPLGCQSTICCIIKWTVNCTAVFSTEYSTVYGTLYMGLYTTFSITKKDNIETYLLYYCSPDYVYFLVLPQQSSLLGLYGPVMLHLLGNKGKYSPSCHTNTENQLLYYCPTRKDITGSITF